MVAVWPSGLIIVRPSRKKVAPAGSSRVPPLAFTFPEPEIVPPWIVVRPLTVMSAVLVNVPNVIVSVVAFKGFVPKFAVPALARTVGIVPAEPGKAVLKLRVPELEVKAAPIELTVPVKLVVPPLESSIVAPVTL